MSSNYPIRDIFATSFASFLSKNSLSPVQISAANAIINCKTGRYGVNTAICDECGHIQIHNCSCRNRSCPNCQGLNKELWIDQRRSEMIDANYFHVVFTVPHKLNPLFLSNQKLLYALLFKAASETLLTLSRDKKYLGADPGIIIVLHTWGQTMSYHPHLHCIVSGAGLTRDKKLVLSGKNFFIPIKAAMKMFRGKFMDALKSYYDSGELVIPSSCNHLKVPEVWQTYIKDLYSIDWCPYIKKTFKGVGDALGYLGRYTNRIAISNSRITDVGDNSATFWYKDYRDNCARKEMTLTNEEFIRRFLMHVLPKRFQKIRYYGYLSNSVKKKNLQILFKLQGKRLFKAKYSADTPKDVLIKEILGIDVHICPRCGKPAMRYAGRKSYLRC